VIDRRKFVRPTDEVVARLKTLAHKAARTTAEDAEPSPAARSGKTDYFLVKAALQERLLEEIGERGLLESDGADVAAAVKDFAARAIASENVALNEVERVRLAEELTDETIGM